LQIIGAVDGRPCTTDTQCGAGFTCDTNNGNQCAPVNDAYCTISTCTNPSVNCAPSPGGNNTPICLQGFCALDCGAFGSTCPTGMTCYNVGVGSICA
jgi:Cys-rich repeat protein